MKPERRVAWPCHCAYCLCFCRVERDGQLCKLCAMGQHVRRATRPVQPEQAIPELELRAMDGDR